MKSILSCLALLLFALSAVSAQANLRFVHGVQGAPAVDVYFNTVQQNNLIFSNIPPLFVTNFASLPSIATVVDGQQVVPIIVTIAGTSNVVIIQNLDLETRNPIPGGIGGGMTTGVTTTLKPQAFTAVLQLAEANNVFLNILVDPLVLSPPPDSAVVRLVMVGGLTNFPTVTSKLAEAQTELVDIGLPGGTIIVGGVNIFDQVFERFVVPANTTNLLIFASRGPVLQAGVNPVSPNPQPGSAIPGQVNIPFGQQPSQAQAGAGAGAGAGAQGQQGQQQGQQGQQQGQQGQQQGQQGQQQVGGDVGGVVSITTRQQVQLRPISIIGNLKLIGGRSYTIFALGEQLTIISSVQALDPNLELQAPATATATSQPSSQSEQGTQTATATATATQTSTPATTAFVSNATNTVVVLQRPVVTSSAVGLKFDFRVLALIASVLFAILG